MALPDNIVPLWINGEQRPASTGETFEVLNPHTNKVAAIAASASSEDGTTAILAASAALDSWENTPASIKRDIFLRAASLVSSDKYRDKIIEINVAETATSVLWGNINVIGTGLILQAAADIPGQLRGQSWPAITPGATVMVQRRAIGVVLAMAPWNAATYLSMRAICTPLACGNTVVLKTSEYSPKSQTLVAEILLEAGLPPGVLNIVSVSRANTARFTSEMIGNPLVRKLNFTGEEAIGRIIAIEAARHLKPCVLELGGKCPVIVLNDADVDDAARAIISGGMVNSGQLCMSTERVIIQRPLVAALESALVQMTSKLKAGDPSKDSSVQLAGLIHEASAQSVISMLDDAKRQGAEFLIGDGKREGTVVKPHLVKGVKPGMKLWDQESFGPVIAIAEVDTIDEAVELANATKYSLEAGLWTKDVMKGLEVARRIRAGWVLLNGCSLQPEAEFGLGGLGGASGYGRFDLEDWTDKRMIALHPPKQQYFLVD